MRMASKLTVLPATSERWPDVEAIFGAKGCSVARGCWCMHYRRSGTSSSVARRAKTYRAGLKSLVETGKPPGLVAYRDGVPVGWVSLAPREEFARLKRSPVMKPVDDKPVWSIICFVVPAEHRGQGVARALLQGAIAYAREHGATVVEAYPVDRGSPSYRFMGFVDAFADAGFQEVGAAGLRRHVMRLCVADR